MALNDLSGLGGAGSGGITSGLGGTGILLSDVANSDTMEYPVMGVSNIASKSYTLAAVPLVSAKVMIDIVQGPPLDFGVDYTVSGNVVSWAGLALDGIIQAGTKFRIKYFIP